MNKTPRITIKWVKAGDNVRGRRKPSSDEVGLKASMSQFYILKALFERLLGRPTYLRLKESAHLPFWKEATRKVLDAMQLSIDATVQIADQPWRDEAAAIINEGKANVATADTIADVFAYLSAASVQLSFHQMGKIPGRRYPTKTIPLTPKYWTLDGHRSVQYVQSPRQRAAAEDAGPRKRPRRKS